MRFVLALLFLPLFAASPQRLIVQNLRVARGDTSDHVDLVRGMSGQLGAITSRRVTWRSSDTNVVKVDSHGAVSGVAPGFALVTARTSTRSGSIRICVATAETVLLAADFDNIQPLLPHPVLDSTVKLPYAQQASGVIQFSLISPNTNVPAACVHWALGTGPMTPMDSNLYFINRRGRFFWKGPFMGVVASATMGPKLPTSAQLRLPGWWNVYTPIRRHSGL